MTEQEILEEGDFGIFDDAEQSEALPFHRYSIQSSGVDFDVAGLVNRLKKNQIYIPSFQREYVWTHSKASHLIESLLLGLPVPGIFVSKDEKERLFVVDGQQRLRSLEFFYDGVFPDGTEFKLIDVQPEFMGKTYETLLEEDRNRLDNSFIRATILQQTAPREIFDSSIYFIFRRLNANTTPLTAQEIRAALFEGNLNNLLMELDKFPLWDNMVAVEANKRKRGQELILRFFALYHQAEAYSQSNSMEDFLTDYMIKNQRLGNEGINQLRILFTKTLEFISRSVEKPFRKITAAGLGRGAFNAAIYDSVMIGVAKRLEKGEIKNTAGFTQAYQGLLADTSYLSAVSASTGRPDQVSKRIKKAVSAFSEIE